MNRLEQLLRKRNESRFHFIYGPGIHDIFMSNSPVPLNLLAALNEALIDNGFDRILHMSPTNILYCIDDRSKANSSHVLWTQRENVLLEGRVSGIETGPFGAASSAQMDQTRTSHREGLSDVHGFRLLDTLMKETQPHKTACVLFDAVTFAEHFDSPRLFFGLINEWQLLPEENKNECFFIIPVEDMANFNRQLEGNHLTQFINYQETGLIARNVLSIGPPNLYEIDQGFSFGMNGTIVDTLEGKQLIRMCVSEQTDLRTWLHRIQTAQDFSSEYFRQNGWLRSSDGDPRSVEEKLEDFIGLDEVKEFVHLLQGLALYSVQHMNSTTTTSFHMIFWGNPGTGKTSIARLFGQIFQESGLLRKGHLVEAKGSDIIAEYVGGTGAKTNRIIDQAIDGILFIDEAYSLSGSDRGGFGREALEVLIKRMEDDRDRLVVILAGYKDEMVNFLKTNPGLERRFPVANRIEFLDFSEDQLKKILSREFGKRDLILDGDVQQVVHQVVTNMYRNKGKNFGNGGEMRNLAESIEIRVKARMSKNNAVVYKVMIEDIPDAYLPKVKNTGMSIEEVLSPFDLMVGMDPIKNHILSLARLKKLEAIHQPGRVVRRDRYLDHYLFLGNPGTGKTTTAKVMSDVLFQLGILRTRNLVEVTAVDLIAGYVGQTPEKTRKVIESAFDGILFIDEAYTLYQGPLGIQQGYGKEVIDTLVKSIDQFKDRFMVIMAGYPDEMVSLVQSNPGLNSRFTKIINFPDYSEEQLGEILVQICDREGYILTDDVLEQAINFLMQIKAMSPRSFGNAREVHRLFRHMTQNLANRIVVDPMTENLDPALPANWNIFLANDVDGFEVIVDPNPIQYELPPLKPVDRPVRKRRK